MSNFHFREKEMSLKAKGLLSLMLSLPEEWDYSEVGLSKLSKDGVGSTAKALDELEIFGYLRRTQCKDTNGKFAGYEYDIYETPQINLPYTENPFTEKPFTENCGQLSTNTLNTNVINNTSNEKKTKRKDEIYETEFEEIWAIYPRKEAKSVGLKHYILARKNGATFEEIKDGVERYVAHCNIKETAKEYIKKGGNYFKEKLWGEEYDMTPKSNNSKSSNNQDNRTRYGEFGITESFEIALKRSYGENEDLAGDI